MKKYQICVHNMATPAEMIAIQAAITQNGGTANGGGFFFTFDAADDSKAEEIREAVNSAIGANRIVTVAPFI